MKSGSGAAVAKILSSYHLTDEYNDLFSEKSKKLIQQIEDQIIKGDMQESDRSCPECSRSFSTLKVENLNIDYCKFCNSMWFDTGELSTLTKLTKDIPSDGLKDRFSKYPCPVCGGQMYEKVFMKKSNILVDTCLEHGIYLENGEIMRILEIMEKGTFYS